MNLPFIHQRIGAAAESGDSERGRPSEPRVSRIFGAATGAVAPLARFRAGQLAQRGLTSAHAAVYRRFGLARQIGNAPILLLTTTGRKSGQPRTVPLMYVPGDEPTLVASNGGSPTHPSWYLNVLADPCAWIEIGGEQVKALARPATGEERERLWVRAVEIYPAYADYQRRTARELPVVVLEPATRTADQTMKSGKSSSSPIRTRN